MKAVLYAASAAAVLGLAAGCSHATPEPQAPHPEASRVLDTTPRSTVGRAQQLVVAANLELHDLEAMRSVATSDADRAAVETQMVAIRNTRDELQSSLPRPGVAPDRHRLAVTSSNLERAMRAGAATEPQVPAQPPLGRPTGRTLPSYPYYGDGTTVPYR